MKVPSTSQTKLAKNKYKKNLCRNILADYKKLPNVHDTTTQNGRQKFLYIVVHFCLILKKN